MINNLLKYTYIVMICNVFSQMDAMGTERTDEFSMDSCQLRCIKELLFYDTSGGSPLDCNVRPITGDILPSALETPTTTQKDSDLEEEFYDDFMIHLYKTKVDSDSAGFCVFLYKIGNHFVNEKIKKNSSEYIDLVDSIERAQPYNTLNVKHYVRAIFNFEKRQNLYAGTEESYITELFTALSQKANATPIVEEKSPDILKIAYVLRMFGSKKPIITREMVDFTTLRNSQ